MGAYVSTRFVGLAGDLSTPRGSHDGDTPKALKSPTAKADFGTKPRPLPFIPAFSSHRPGTFAQNDDMYPVSKFFTGTNRARVLFAL
jgi:hypothetical protein